MGNGNTKRAAHFMDTIFVLEDFHEPQDHFNPPEIATLSP